MAPTKWGIVAAGRISNDFVVALSTLPREDHQVVAVAGRNFENAKKFGERHGISKVYATYEELARDPDVEKHPSAQRTEVSRCATSRLKSCGLPV